MVEMKPPPLRITTRVCSQTMKESEAMNQVVTVFIFALKRFVEHLGRAVRHKRERITGRAVTSDALELNNGISLEVRPASFRKPRGPTYVAVIADELAYWYEFAAVIGRHGGKSSAMAVLATYLAGLCDHSDAWCLASAACCSAWRWTSAWRRSSSSTCRPASSAARSCDS
jgi:hypothetical protein